MTLVAGVGLRLSDNIFVASELQKDIDYPVNWRTGAEYSIYKKVFFRTGFNLDPDAAYFGLGAQKKNLKFDYAVRFNNLLGAAHQASAVFVIPSKSKK